MKYPAARDVLPARARALLAALGLLTLPGCMRFLIDGRGRTYHGEYAAWLPHMSFIGLLVITADVWACFHVWNSRKRGLIAKLLWTVFIWCCPFLGFILFFLFGWEG